MFLIGITGPTGAGKTTALRELEKLGGCVLDADAVYHSLLEGDPGLQQAIQDRFGGMKGEDGRFDRKRLGAIVFRDPQAMADLNRITRPYIVSELNRRLDEARAGGCPAAAVDAIGLWESGIAQLCDVTLAIVAPSELRVARIMAREGISEDYARARVRAQKPDEYYTSRCDYTLVNDGESSQRFGEKARALFESILNGDIQ